MRIATKLTIAALVPAFMALALGGALFLSYRSIAALEEKEKAAHRISNGMSDLNDLAHSYVLHHEDRPRRQFPPLHDEISRLLGTVTFEDREQRKLLAHMAAAHETRKTLFLKLVSNYERHASAKDDLLLEESEERLVSQLRIRSHEARAAAARLLGLISNDIVTSQRRLFALTAGLLVSTAAALTVLLFGLMRNVVASIERLRKGSEVIGGGRLDHRIGLSSNDEIGALSEAFDRMTETLQATTVTRDELAAEVAERKRAEERVRHLASFPELNPNPVIEVDSAGKIVFSNPATRKILANAGMAEEDGRAFLPADLDDMLRNWDGKNESVRYREASIRDRIFGVTVFLTPRFGGARLYGFDITERNQAEMALRDSEHRLNRAQEIAHLGSWELDLVNNALTWSDEVYRIFGLQPREFGATYEAFLEAVHPDDRAAVDAAYSDSLREGRDTYDIEHRVVRKSTGEIRVVHERCGHVRDGSGTIIRSVGMVHDITERRRAEEELRAAKAGLEDRVAERTAELAESESRFRSLVEHSPVGILIVQDGRIVFRNPELVRLFGPLPDGMSLDTLQEIHPEDMERFAELCREVRRVDPRSMDTDLRFLPHGDSPRRVDLAWVQVRTSPITFRSGQAVLVAMVDVTRTKELEHIVKVREKMASLGHVSAGIAHEIRNPLSGINISAFNLESLHRRSEGLSPEEKEKARAILSQLTSASDKIASVIQRVMDFAKPVPPRLDRIDLNAAVEEAVLLSLTALKKKKITLEKSLQPDLPICSADPRLIEQVVMNLVTNAAQAMEETAGPRRIEVASSVEDRLVIIRVSDSGPGIPPHMRGRIFDPFFTTRKDGYGIGLSFSHRVITDHGGSLSVGTSRWGGAEFRIGIPVE